MGRLEDKVVLITGGASGIGKACAKLFLEEGAKLVLNDISLINLKDTKYEIADGSDDVLIIDGDVSNPEDVRRLGSAIGDKFGYLNCAVNCAGIFPSDDGGLLDTPLATWDKVLNINLKGIWLCCQEEVKLMLKTGGGSIVNIASFVAFVGAATAQVAYTASKGAVLSLTREIAVEFARKNIRVNALCPGPIETPLLKELLSDEQRRNRRLVHIPMGRFGKAEEIAYGALFLCSEESSFMTGSALIIDGGITSAYVTPE